jgi:rhodanese-related sulfurtransferase
MPNRQIGFGLSLILCILLGATPASESSAGQQPLDRSSPPPIAAPNDAECPPATTEAPPDRTSAKTTPTPSLPDALQPGNRSPQADCYLSPQDAAAQFRNRMAYLIDVRASSAFEQYRIPSALNLPAYAIKTKPFLKTRPLILIDAGYRSRTLETLCRELRQQQYQVAILDGGLDAWRRQIAPLAGDPLAQDRLQTISPAVYFAERDDARWQIVDVSAQPLPLLAALPGTAAVPATLDPPSFGERLRQIAAQRQQAIHATPHLLLVNANGDYDRPRSLLRDADIANVYYLQDGLNGYDAYLKSLAALRERTSPPAPDRRCALAPR